MPSVLAVDDSSISRKIYSSVLSDICQLEIVEDAEQAWQKISHSKYDLLITDVNLPGMNGIELLKKIRARDDYGNMPIIVVSGDGESIRDAKQLEFTFWLLKPVDPKSLVQAIKTILKLN